MTYTPQPTPAVNTGMHRVSVRREPTVVGVRQTFEDTFGAYVPADWTLDAECTRPGTNPEWFYPTRGGTRSKENRAMEVCGRCVVRQVCLDDALDFESSATAPGDRLKTVYGIRGGKTAKERQAIIGQRKAEARAKAKAAALEDYAAGQMSLTAMALKHHLNRDTILAWAKEADLPLRGPGWRPNGSTGVA